MYKNLPDNIEKISLAIIDCFYELFTNKSDFLDLELFEIQLIKYGLELNSNLKELFNDFISTSKSKEQVDYFSKIISYGIKNKYKHFNEKLDNLKILYDIIIWIETHTEFTSLKYIDEVLDNNTEAFYRFVLFYTFKKDNINEVYEFSNKNVKTFMQQNKTKQDNLEILELLFQYLKRPELIVKNFINLSKDKDYFKFILIQKKLSNNEVIKKIISSCETDEYIYFLLYLITFNPYIIIDDFKINIFKNNTRNFYQFLKAILYRFQYYKINQRTPEELSLFFKYIFIHKKFKEIKSLLQLIDSNDIILFEPIILFILEHNDNNELPILLLFKTIKAHTSSNDFIINYNLIHSIIENIINRNIENMIFTIFLGNFKKYLSSKQKFKNNELKNFFVTVNLFLTKTKINKELKERLFKMNLKFFEIYIKNITVLNPMLLTISKHYSIILNKYLKEYDKDKDINLFINEIKDIIFSDNKLINLKIISLNNINPNNISFTFISSEIQKILIEDFNKNHKNIELKTNGYFLSSKFFNILVVSKLLLLYELFYPIFYKLHPQKLTIKNNKNELYILDNENIIRKCKKELFLVKEINFYYHFINKIYSLLIITIASLLGFRIIIDAIIVGNNKLLILGFSIIIIALIIDYLLFFFFKKFENLHFFKIKIKDKNYVFYSKDRNLLAIISD